MARGRDGMDCTMDRVGKKPSSWAPCCSTTRLMAPTFGFPRGARPERLWPLEGNKIIDAFLVEMNETGDKGQRTISRWWPRSRGSPV